MTRDEVATLLARRRDAIAQRNRDAFAALYHESARLESPLVGSATGRGAIVDTSFAFLDAFSDVVIDEDDTVIEGNRAAMMAQFTGTQVGPLLGLAPSGRSVRFPMAFLIRCEDQMIVEERRIYDFSGLLIQLGLLKAKPA